MDKISYRFRDPQRYDIIVFPYKYEEDTYYIKRIIGMPGETVQVIGGYVYINGELLESDIYGAEPMESGQLADQPITLGADEYFVLGDNRNHSSDSRDPSVALVRWKGATFWTGPGCASIHLTSIRIYADMNKRGRRQRQSNCAWSASSRSWKNYRRSCERLEAMSVVRAESMPAGGRSAASTKPGAVLLPALWWRELSFFQQD